MASLLCLFLYVCVQLVTGQLEPCHTKEKEIGNCVPITECRPYAALIQESRNNPKAVQQLREAHCGFQGSTPKVCCPLFDVPTGTSSSPSTITTTSEHAAISEDQSFGIVVLPDAPDCGTSNITFFRIVDYPPKLGNFPWMALLGYKGRRSGDATRWLCGGSLISARHVLTAAHCIHTREQELYLVRLGELDISRDDEGATPVDVPIKTLVKHQEYNPKAFTNDIGILVLYRNVQFTDVIKPICVPRSTELRKRNFEDYTPIIAGWGSTEFLGPTSSHLRFLQIPVLSNVFCANAYSARKDLVIDQRFLCAGFKKGTRDACLGDSGGPLIIPIYNSETHNSFFHQIGVVSSIRKCDERDVPGVYTSVTSFVPWIEETVTRN